MCIRDSRQTDAIGVAPRQRAFVEAAGNGAAAEIGRGEAHAFFLGEADHIDMERQLPPGAVQVLDDDDCGAVSYTHLTDT